MPSPQVAGHLEPRPLSPRPGPQSTQEYSRVNLVWNWVSFSKRGRSFSMAGRIVILKREEGK